MTKAFKIISKFLFYILFIAASSKIFAQTQKENVIIIKTESDLQLVGKKIYFLEDKSRSLTIEDILISEKQSVFSLNDKNIFIRKASSSAFWLKFIVENQSEKDLWIELGSTYLWYIDYYTEINGKYKLAVETGSLRPKNSKAFATNLFLLPLDRQKRQTVYVRLYTLRPVEVLIQIGSIISILQNKSKYDYVISVFVGVMLIMFLYNLFLFLTIRDNLYLWYIGYIVTIVPSAMYANNYPIIDFLEESVAISLHRHPFAWVNFSSIFIGLYAIYFLNLSKKIFLKRVIQIVSIYLTILLGFVDYFEIFSHHLLIPIYQRVTLAHILFLTGMSLYLWIYEKNSNARFYFFGWIWFFLGLIGYFLTINGLVDYNYLTRSSILFGIAIESLFFSLALGDRINIIRSENLQLKTEQNEMLEIEVKKRTYELTKANEMLEQTNLVARIGGWEWDVKTQSMHWSKITKEIYEVEEGFQLNATKPFFFFQKFFSSI